jgi:UDP-N-acetyl-D-mannosaminuronic acid dehydrogenase
MKFTLDNKQERTWEVKKIGVIGPGIVGMPMAALLANARIRIGTDQPARVHIIQRNSKNSGWKVDAINRGKSVIGGVEPELDVIVQQTVADGLLSAGHDYNALADADVILVAIQTDKKGFEPDYGPLFSGLTDLASALQKKPSHTIPLIIFESTLAPSSMATVIKDHFEEYNLVEGRDILLGNSPNRVMPGRLVERVTHSDKLVAGLSPATPLLISHLYQYIVTKGTLYKTNSLTAEVVKTLENAYRDVRIAFSAEMVSYCDKHDVDFYTLRDKVNQRLEQNDEASKNPNCVPSGGLLIPMVGVGGHCLPKDGILLLWRKILAAVDTTHSLILNARAINDAAPSSTIQLMEKHFGSIDGASIAILGTAYRFNSEDTRNSPSIQLALQLIERGCKVCLHDPYVKPDDQNLLRFKVDSLFTRNLGQALQGSDFLVFATAHHDYLNQKDSFLVHCSTGKVKGVFDGCNLFPSHLFSEVEIPYAGIGRGKQVPDNEFVDFVFKSFRSMESGIANEVLSVCQFLNGKYAVDSFNKIEFEEVRRLAASCSTGCNIAKAGEVGELPKYNGFYSQLSAHAVAAGNKAQ